jgi:hypothetical protein
VSIDQAGEDDGPRSVDHLGLGGDGDGVVRSDRLDPSGPHEQNPVLDLVSGDRNDPRVDERSRLPIRSRRRRDAEDDDGHHAPE